jgi:hypothetical protein
MLLAIAICGSDTAHAMDGKLLATADTLPWLDEAASTVLPHAAQRAVVVPWLLAHAQPAGLATAVAGQMRVCGNAACKHHFPSEHPAGELSGVCARCHIAHDCSKMCQRPQAALRPAAPGAGLREAIRSAGWGREHAVHGSRSSRDTAPAAAVRDDPGRVAAAAAALRTLADARGAAWQPDPGFIGTLLAEADARLTELRGASAPPATGLAVATVTGTRHRDGGGSGSRGGSGDAGSTQP